jgi:hypothetical protein
MLISPEYQALNAQLHQDRPDYGTSSKRWVSVVPELVHGFGCTSVLDYGAGKQELRKALASSFWERGWLFMDYDPAVPEISAPPSPADLVICSDVMEHIEPDCLDAVLDDLKRLARKAIFLNIATRPAVKTLADGRNAHLIVEPMDWWLPRLEERWEKESAYAHGGEFIFIGIAK